MTQSSFVLRYLPPPPARVLEIGCGPDGDLAVAIAAAGYEVVAVDPVAPEGTLFRRIPFAEFDDPGPFAAVVASLSLHHIADLAGTSAAIAGLLAPGGRLVLDEWDHDQFLDDATSRWYFHQRQASAAVAGATESPSWPPDYETWRDDRRAGHHDLHGQQAMIDRLSTYFRQIFFTWRPYLYRYDLHPDIEPLERALIEEGAIKATGFRWVGELDRMPPNSERRLT